MRVVKVSPAVYPVTLREVKNHLRIDDEDHFYDELINSLISTATEAVQEETNRQFVTCEYLVYLDRWWYTEFKVPYPPLLTVSSITYYDLDNNSQTLAASNYDVNTWGTPGRIRWAYSSTIPSLRYRPDAVTIDFTSGYCLSFTAVAATDVITVGEILKLANGAKVRLRSSDTLPAGLVENKDYFLISTSGLTFKLSETVGGSAVDITDTGTGKHYIDLVPEPVKQALKIHVGTWFDKVTEDVETSFSQVQQMPMASKYLLAPYRVVTL